MKTYTLCPACGAVNGVEPGRPEAPQCGACHAPLSLFKDGVSELGASQLNKLVDHSPLPVAVDFWAPWCGPCKAFAPVFRQAAAELGGQVAFAKVDTQANPFAGDMFHISAIPTLVVFKDGVEKARLSGALPLPQYKAWLAQALAA